MIQHTPEPWGLLPAHTLVNIKGLNGEQICQLTVSDPNARRIVACVNACAGMNDPEAEITQLRQDKAELLETLEVIKSTIIELTDDLERWVKALRFDITNYELLITEASKK